jgi:phage gpG-like protein
MQGTIIVKDHISAVLAALGGKLKQPKVVAEAMGLAVVSLTLRSFNDPGVRAAPWAPLTPATLARKIAEGTSTAILKRHVVLARSWRITELTARYVKVGTDRPYAAFHQWGTSRVPARPMLPLQGDPGAAKFTPLAERRMVSVAKAALAHLLLGPRTGQGPKPPAA